MTSIDSRERRKVQMVEHPTQRSVARITSTTQSRPLSADDIQKAKMRAQYMQNKNGKTIACSDEKIKPESENKGIALPASLPPLVPKSNVQNELGDLEEQKKLDDFSKIARAPETSPMNSEEPPWKKCKRIQIRWRKPSGTFFSSACSDWSCNVFSCFSLHFSDNILSDHIF